MKEQSAVQTAVQVAPGTICNEAVVTDASRLRIKTIAERIVRGPSLIQVEISCKKRALDSFNIYVLGLSNPRANVSRDLPLIQSSIEEVEPRCVTSTTV